MPSRLLIVGVSLAALALAGAAPQDGDDPLRQANAAFARGEYVEALALYEKAEERAADPGLVAFNKGATLYRLGRWREAQLCYLRCLEDQEAPPARRAKGLYDLGNCLLREGAESQSAKTLALAIEFYRACLGDAAGDDLHGQARHNLELARLLWLKARANPSQDRDPREDTPESPRKEPEGQKETGPEDGSEEDGKPAGKHQTALQQALQNRQKAQELEQLLAGKGNPRALPDSDQLHPQDSDDAAAQLEQAAQRILREQIERRERDAVRRGTHPNVKDW
jgi:tetratricopeptide (TPR) repeat protein